MFDDKRSRKVIFVSHCVLNQDAKLDACAHYPGAIKEVTELLVEAGAGIIQLPCPELLYLGLDRDADRAADLTVASEDSRIARRMVEEGALTLCGKLADDVLRQMMEYRKHGFEVLGLVGINGSPTCGVETTWREDEERDGPGIFIKVLAKKLEKAGTSLKITGIKANDPERAVAAVKNLL